MACASSTISRAPYFLHSGIISGSGAMSPSMLYRPSTTTSLPLSSGSRCKQALQFLHVLVAEALGLAVAQLGAVDDAGVVFLVQDDVVARARSAR